MQLPVTVLNANTKRETGKKAQFANIAAAKVCREREPVPGRLLFRSELQQRFDRRLSRTSFEPRWGRAPCLRCS